MEIKFDVYFKQSLGTLFKSNECIIGGIDANTNLQLELVDYLTINYKVGGIKYTDTVLIKDRELNLINIPFKSTVLKGGLNEFEVVAKMKNGDVKTSQTYTYSIEESIGEGDQIDNSGNSNGHTHANKAILDGITQEKIIEWDSKANVEVDLSNYYTKNEIYNKQEVDAGLLKKSDVHSHPYKASTYVPAWSEVTGKPAIPNKTSQLTNDSSFATESFVTNKIAEAELGGGEVDLSGYATKDDLRTKADKSELFSKSYNDLTDKPDIPVVDVTKSYVDTELAKKSNEHSHPYRLDTWLPPNDHAHTNKTALDTITSAKTQSWDAKSDFSGNYNDLTNQPTIPNKTSQLTNDSSFATEAFVTNKIAEAELGGGEVDLSGYATVDQLNTKVDKVNGKQLSTEDYTSSEKTKLAGLTNYTHPSTHSPSIITQDSNNRFVTDAEKATWNNKSNFDGDYNTLTNKPSIPVVDVTKSYVDTELDKKLNSEGHVLTENNYTTAEKNKLSGLSNYTHPDNATTRHVSDTEKANWNSKSNFSGSYNDLTDKPTIPTIDVNKEYVDAQDADLESKITVLSGKIEELEQGGNIIFRDVVEGEIFKVVESSQPTDIYGSIVLSNQSITINEGMTSSFTIKLDKQPTNNQTVAIVRDNSDVELNTYSLVFTPSNYNVSQNITITTFDDDDTFDKSCTLSISSSKVQTKTLVVNIINNDEDATQPPVDPPSENGEPSITNGLIHGWKFLDEPTNSKITDLYGNYHMDVPSEYIIEDGYRKGRPLYSSSNNMSRQFSFAAKFKLIDSLSANFPVLSFGSIGGSANSQLIFHGGSKLTMYSGGKFGGGYTPTPSQEIVAVITHDTQNNVTKIFINGVLEKTITNQAYNIEHGDSIYIANGYPSPSNVKFKNLFIWNRLLTEEEAIKISSEIDV